MEQAEYKQLVACLEGLMDEQFDGLLETMESDGVQRLVMVRMAERKCCPHYEDTKVVKHGVEFGSQRFWCKGCGKTFTALTGTPFHRLRDKAKRLENAACMADGLSVRKTAARIEISVQKAFRWRHKFLAFLSEQKPAALTGVVEADETLFPVSSARECRAPRRREAARPRTVLRPRRPRWSWQCSEERKLSSTKCLLRAQRWH